MKKLLLTLGAVASVAAPVAAVVACSSDDSTSIDNLKIAKAYYASFDAYKNVKINNTNTKIVEGLNAFINGFETLKGSNNSTMKVFIGNVKTKVKAALNITDADLTSVQSVIANNTPALAAAKNDEAKIANISELLNNKVFTENIVKAGLLVQLAYRDFDTAVGTDTKTKGISILQIQEALKAAGLKDVTGSIKLPTNDSKIDSDQDAYTTENGKGWTTNVTVGNLIIELASLIK